MHKHVLLATCALMAPIAIISCPAFAQDAPSSAPEATAGITEVVVTAERRASRLQKAALSVTAISADSIAKTGKTSYDDVLTGVAGVQVQLIAGNGPPSPLISIRGLGTDGKNKPASTAVYVDGVQINRQGAQFYDLERVEVLRGPQGTLYGSTATAGGVNIITKDPKLGDTSGWGELDLGSYGTVHTSGAVNVPVSERSALRFAFNQTRRDGYAKNDGQSEVNARVKYLYVPDSSTRVLLGAEYYTFSGISFGDGRNAQDDAGNLVGPYVAEQGFGHTRVAKIYANLSHDFSFGTLTYIPAFQKLKSDLSVANPLVGSQELISPFDNLTSHEIRLSNPSDSKLTWVVGAYYRNRHADSSVNIGWDSALPNILNRFVTVEDLTNNTQTAIFAQATAPVGEKTRLTLGLRSTHDVVHLDQNFSFLAGAPFPVPVGTTLYPYNKSFDSLNYLARIEHDLTPRNLVYASVSTGYRPGGPSVQGVNYEVEKVTAYEVGSKNRFFDNRLQVNLAAYLNDYPNFQNEATLYGASNLQISTIVGIPARFKGLEIEAVWAITPNDRLDVSTSFSEAKYISNGLVTDLSGNTATVTTDEGRVPHAPGTIATVGYSHDFALSDGGRLSAAISSSYRSKQYIAFNSCLYDANGCTSGLTVGRLTQGAYNLVDVALTYTPASKPFSISVYGRNVTDEVYKTGNDGTLAFLGAPATYGVILRANY